MKHVLVPALLAVLAPGIRAAAPANPVAGLAGPLSGLINPQAGKAMHESSWDRTGGNADMRAVDPGQTITLLDHKGAGIIRRFWATIAPRAHKEIHAQAILRMYWDGETKPSVEAPVGAFFGVGFGEQADYISLPLNETSGGYNCYWPMPFKTGARWTLTNLSSSRIDAFYYNIDFTGYDKLPDDLRYFHAQFRRENPTTPNKNYTILEATGPGHFVGTALFMQNRRGKGLAFLEGDEMISIDGEAKPSIIGTGTEDYFSSGWYYDRGVYSAPYHGIPIKDEKLGRVSTYRWHIEDAMPYQRSIKVTIEHGHANDHEADYSSVAYWYQAEDHAAFPPLPAAAALLPYTPPLPKTIPGAIEGEALVDKAKADYGDVKAQDMSIYPAPWAGDAQLWWTPDQPNKRLTINFEVPEDGQYEIEAYFTQAADYGMFDFELDGQRAYVTVDLYAETVKAAPPMRFGPTWLRRGPNKVTVLNIGKNAKSTGYLFGLDAVILKPAGSTSRTGTVKKPLVIAHRGASARAPENTMAAFRLARELGADQIELDTSFTADGVLACLHDGTLDRTTNGDGPLSSMAWADARKLDAGSWKDAKYAGEAIPSLEEVLREFNDISTLIEIKVPAGADAAKLGEAVADLVAKLGAEDRVVVQSFNATAVARAKERNPRLTTGFLYGAAPASLPAGISALQPAHTLVTEDFMRDARAKGMMVSAWTVDDPARMRQLLDLGVTGIITNVPDVLKALRDGS